MGKNKKKHKNKKKLKASDFIIAAKNANHDSFGISNDSDSVELFESLKLIYNAIPRLLSDTPSGGAVVVKNPSLLIGRKITNIYCLGKQGVHSPNYTVSVLAIRNVWRDEIEMDLRCDECKKVFHGSYHIPKLEVLFALSTKKEDGKLRVRHSY